MRQSIQQKKPPFSLLPELLRHTFVHVSQKTTFTYTLLGGQPADHQRTFTVLGDPDSSATSTSKLASSMGRTTPANSPLVPKCPVRNLERFKKDVTVRFKEKWTTFQILLLRIFFCLHKKRLSSSLWPPETKKKWTKQRTHPLLRASIPLASNPTKRNVRFWLSRSPAYVPSSHLAIPTQENPKKPRSNLCDCHSTLQNKVVPNGFLSEGTTPETYMDVSKNRDTPQWMVCNGKPY